MGIKFKPAIIGIALTFLLSNYSPLNAADNKPKTSQIKTDKQTKNLESKVSDSEIISQIYLNKAENTDLWKSNPDKALEYYEKALKYNPNCKIAYFHRNELYYNLKRYDDSLKDVQKAFELDPKDPETPRHVAEANYKIGNHQEAIKYWGKQKDILKSAKTDVIMHNDGMNSYEINRKDSLMGTYLMRAQEYNTTEEYENAVKECEEALKLFPKNPFILNELETAKDGLKKKNKIIIVPVPVKPKAEF